VQCTRRGILESAAAGLVLSTTTTPSRVFAEDLVTETVEARPCNENLYMILRVQEATQQETRLVSSGKFRDLQRANVKLAVNLMLKNYALLDNVLAASALSGPGKSYEASTAGRDAVDALQQILEYFDSSARSLNVETIGGEKLDFVLRALDASNSNLEKFLSYMPADELRKAQKVVDAENAKNYDEYKAANPDQPAYLNPTPKTA